MQLHHICGRNIQLSDDHTIAARRDGEKLHKDGLVHTAWPVAVGKVFQVTVMETAEKWAGSMVREGRGGGEEEEGRRRWGGEEGRRGEGRRGGGKKGVYRRRGERRGRRGMQETKEESKGRKDVLLHLVSSESRALGVDACQKTCS